MNVYPPTASSSRTGYKANLPAVPYLGGLIDKVDMVDGFPVLDEAFQSSICGLYITGFAATRTSGRSSGLQRLARPPPRSSSRAFSGVRDCGCPATERGSYY